MKSNVPSPQDDIAEPPRISAQSPFRAIRHKLFNEGKLVRYLGYAIGEVILFIVGILFALKINDWNEDRKAQAEFDQYIVQLREDVREAINLVNRTSTGAQNFATSIDASLSFLEQPRLEPKDLEAFELGLSRLGGYGEIHVHVGLFGELLNGDADIIKRDQALAQEALRMEGGIERYLSNLDHIYNRIDIASGNINPFVGRGTGAAGGGRDPLYNLDELKNSEEFKRTSHTLVSELTRIIDRSEKITEILESFLTVLEEND